MAQKMAQKPIYIDPGKPIPAPPPEPGPGTPATKTATTEDPQESTGVLTRIKQRLFRRAMPAPPASLGRGERAKAEERRATRKGPQLFSLVVDHSGSMEEGNKAREATTVLREIIKYARKVNTTDQTGTKVYFYTQVILFADRLEDITHGMTRPPADFTPEHAFTVRHPDHRERLGNLTNYQAPLAHVYKTLTGKDGMTNERKKEGMPAPIVLFISDGKPNKPEPVQKARQLALLEAERIKSLALPEAIVFHPILEEIWHPPTDVRLVTIGLGTDKELDQDLLRQMCSRVSYEGKELLLYLHCPKPEDLYKIGTQIAGTVTKADQTSDSESLEKVIYSMQR